MSRRVRGVHRGYVLLGALLIAALVGGVVVLSESLRHPSPTGVSPRAAIETSGDDPRTEIDCPSPEEGVAAAEGLTGSSPITVTSSDLHQCPASYDRRLVAYEGEAVGALMRRPGGAWVQLNDDVYAGTHGPLPAHRDYRGGNDGVGVFLPDDVADRIGVVGGPRAHGDLVAVTGVFHRTDPASGEVAVIRARSGDVVRAGAPLPDVRLRDREIAAAVLAAAALALIAWERRGARRRRRG